LILYRKGYELEEIHSWTLRNQVAWKKVADAKDHEKAIDKLTSLKRFEPRQGMFRPSDEYHDWSTDLACQYKAKGYESLFKLAASEYEALAKSDLGEGSNAEDMRKRLLEKVQKLKSILVEGPEKPARNWLDEAD
jgi:hypothetical protein